LRHSRRRRMRTEPQWTPAMTWSAAQYVRFEEERTRPVRDLVQRIPLAEVATAADIGCGPGNSTEVLRARYPQARVVGLDSSPDTARKRLPDIAFEVADIRDWRAKDSFDVILANAVLQWIPDHETLFPALMARLCGAARSPCRCRTISMSRHIG
jgi:trans-aconitate 2-methyltransferase